jgi:hypothetical protein
VELVTWKEDLMRALSLVLLSCLAGLLLAGCGPTAPSGKQGEESKVPTSKLGPPDFSMGSRQFVAEFKKDSKAAHQKYKGKTIELLGRVVSVDTNLSGDPVVMLEGEPKKSDWAACITAERYPAKKLAPGQSVSIKGRGHDWFPGPNLLDCEILRVEGPKPQAFTADELAAEVGKDVEAAKKKYEDKWMLLSGEVAEVKFREGGAADAVLKTKSKGPRVEAVFMLMDKKSAAALKAARRIEVLGRFSTLHVSKDKVELFGCVLAGESK